MLTSRPLGMGSLSGGLLHRRIDLKRVWTAACSHAWAVLGLAALLPVLFPTVVWRNEFLYQRDIYAYWLPLVESFVRTVSEGAWPLWNPYLGFGMPMLADPNLQYAYPPTWLNFVMRPEAYYRLFTFSHLLFAGLGAYACARRLSLSRVSAFLAGAVWMASGAMLSLVSMCHHFAGASWMGWVLWALLRALESGGRAPVAVFAVTLAGQLLAGSADMVVFTTMSGSFLVLGWWLSLPERTVPRRTVVSAMGVVVGGGAMAIALAAIQWLPAMGLLLHSSRQSQGVIQSSGWSVHPLWLVDVIVPQLLSGGPISRGLREALFESREPLLYSLYLGLPAVAVALLPAPASLRWLRRTATAAVLFFLVAALGRHTPLYQALLSVTPLELFRFPTKYLVPASFFGALLVGVGFEGWLLANRGAARMRTTWAVAITGACVVLVGVALGIVWGKPGLAFAWMETAIRPEERVSTLQRLAAPALQHSLLAGLGAIVLLARRTAEARWRSPALVGLIVMDLVTAGQAVNPTVPAPFFAYRPPLLAHLEPGLRLHVSGERVRAAAGDEATTNVRAANLLSFCEALTPPCGARWGLRGSFDGDPTGLAAPPQSRLSAVVSTSAGSEAGLRLLRLGAVDRVVSLDERWLGVLPEELRGESSVTRSVIHVFRVPRTLPKAYMVARARLASDQEAYSLLLDPAFDPQAEVLLDPTSGEVSGSPGPDVAATVRERLRRGDRVVFDVETNTSGWLVVADAYREGWKADVDGVPAPVVRANLLFRAIRVPAGRHVVDLRFRPWTVVVGIAISGLAGMIVIVALASGPRRLPLDLSPARSS